MPLYTIDTILMYRMRYVVEANNPKDASTFIETHQVDEFSQKCLDETVTSVREITQEDFQAMCRDLENNVDPVENGSHWMGNDLIHKVDYDT